MALTSQRRRPLGSRSALGRVPSPSHQRMFASVALSACIKSSRVTGGRGRAVPLVWAMRLLPLGRILLPPQARLGRSDLLLAAPDRAAPSPTRPLAGSGAERYHPP